jgi:hypothetical protein
VHDVQSRVGSIAGSASDAGAAIDRTAAIVDEVSAAAAAVAASITRQATATAEITRNIQDSAATSGSVATSIAQVRNSVGVTRDASTQLAVASDNLAEKAEDLRDEVEHFLIAMGRAGERRRQVRRVVDRPTTLLLRDGARVTGRLVNIGTGGCAVVCTVGMPPGDEVMIEIDGRPVAARIIGSHEGVTRFQFRTDAALASPHPGGAVAA